MWVLVKVKDCSHNVLWDNGDVVNIGSISPDHMPLPLLHLAVANYMAWSITFLIETKNDPGQLLDPPGTPIDASREQ